MTIDALVNDLEDFKAWRADNLDFDLIDYLMCVGTPDILAATLQLLKPDLVWVNGDYFLKHNFSEENFKEWMDLLKDVREVQRVINHFHVSSFMQGTLVSNDVAVHVAREIASVWSRQFENIGLIAEYHGHDLETAQVTLFRK